MTNKSLAKDNVVGYCGDWVQVETEDIVNLLLKARHELVKYVQRLGPSGQ